MGGRVGHVEDVVTDDAARGRGLGRAMLGRIAEIAHARGCYKVILDCAEKNSSFYEKNGYRRAEVQMRLDVDPSRAGFGARRSAPTSSVPKAAALLALSALLLLSVRHARRP